jgi:NAD(P)-dependent dehydrogenase (short-subunit alcohol dehydrogenase family)
LSQIQDLVGDAGLSVLVNNAATQVLGGVDSLTVSDWHHTLDVNLLAPFVLTQGLLPPLEKAHGCVINISSIHARLTKPNFVAYATSKAALSAMTRAMAVDLGSRVRVNAIEPAAIETDMLKSGFAGQPEKFAELQACHPQGRIGSPEEVAALALSVAGGELRFLHGACIGIDGGISGRLHDPN